MDSMPTWLTCERCGTGIGALITPSLDEPSEEGGPRAICMGCVDKLSEKKEIVPDSVESWDRLLNG